MRYRIDLFDGYGADLGEAYAETPEEAVTVGTWYRTVGQVHFTNIVDTES